MVLRRYDNILHLWEVVGFCCILKKNKNKSTTWEQNCAVEVDSHVYTTKMVREMVLLLKTIFKLLFFHELKRNQLVLTP